MKTEKTDLFLSHGNQFLEIGEAIQGLVLELKEVIFFQGGVINRICIAKSDNDTYLISGGKLEDSKEYQTIFNIDNLNYTMLCSCIEEINIILNI